MISLEVIQGQDQGRTLQSAAAHLSIGRGNNASLQLGDPHLSAEHGLVLQDEETIRYRDLGSTNGTYVNSHRVEAGRLSEGDELMIGKFHLRVSKGDG